MSKKPPLGSGKRFSSLEKKLESKGVEDPSALAAVIGRKKYGDAKMQKLAKAGRKQPSK